MAKKSNTTKKKSLGFLKENLYRKPKSPALTGKIDMQRHTIVCMLEEMDKNQSDEVKCNIAAWIHMKQSEKYVGIEISPPYRPRQPEDAPRPNLEFLFKRRKEDEH